MIKERFLTTFETARVCHVSPGSVVRWIREGKLTASVTAGGHHRVQLTHLVEFLKKLRMPLPEEFAQEEDCRVLMVSSSPQCLKQIQKMLRRRFPDAVIEGKS